MDIETKMGSIVFRRKIKDKLRELGAIIEKIIKIKILW